MLACLPRVSSGLPAAGLFLRNCYVGRDWEGPCLIEEKSQSIGYKSFETDTHRMRDSRESLAVEHCEETRCTGSDKLAKIRQRESKHLLGRTGQATKTGRVVQKKSPAGATRNIRNSGWWTTNQSPSSDLLASTSPTMMVDRGPSPLTHTH